MSDSGDDLALLTGGGNIPEDAAAPAPAEADDVPPADSTAAPREKKRRDKKSKKDKKKKKDSKRHRSERSRDADGSNADEAAALRALQDEGSDEEDDIFDFDNISDEESDDDRRRGGGLLEDDVSEGDEDSMDEPVRPEDEAEEAAAKRRIQEHKHVRTGIADVLEQDDDAAAAELEARYRTRKQMEALGRHRQLSARDSSQRFSAAFLPRPTDPKVFAVKVRPGFTRILVARIVNKCRAYLRGENQAGVRQDLGIMSVFSVDHVRDWIYLEAHRQRFVETAIAGLEHVFRFKITLVDPRELMQLLERQATKKDSLQVGQYVRVKAGNYAGDIGLVTALQEEGRIVVVQLMPRENFQGQQHREVFKKGSQKQPQHLFVPHLALGAHECSNGDWKWAGCHFDSNGYLLQPFHANRLLTGAACPPPTVDELVVFHAHNRDEVERAVESLGAHKQLPKASTYKRDEPVRVVTGQLAGVAGRVVDMDRARNRITVATGRGTTGIESVTVPLDEVSKLYQAGDHIVVESGPFAGEAGTVLFTNHAEAVVLSDEGQREFRVEVAHCRASTMKAARPHTLGSLKLFDLVELSDDKGVGCIVGFAGTTVNVMTPHNTVIRTTVQHVKQVLNTKNTGVDRLLNSVNAKDAIVVDAEGVPKQFAKLRGTVQQVHIDVLFVTSAQLKANAGMFAISAKSVLRIGGQSKHQKQSTFATLNTVYREPHPAKPAPQWEGQVGAARSAISSALHSARTVDYAIDDVM